MRTVEDALQAARNFQEIEKHTKEQLSPCGVIMGWETLADIRERLESGRFRVVRYLIEARKEASAEEAAEIEAVLQLLKMPC